MVGSIYCKRMVSWQFVQNGMVTLTQFMNESLSGITKLKIKK